LDVVLETLHQNSKSTEVLNTVVGLPPLLAL